LTFAHQPVLRQARWHHDTTTGERWRLVHPLRDHRRERRPV